MGSEDHVGPLLADGGDHFLDRAGGEGCLGTGSRLTRLENDALGRDPAHVEDLGPAVAEPAIADHQTLLVGGELTGDRLHAEGAAAGDDDRAPGVVHRFQNARDVAHDPLKALGHVVQGAVGIDDGIFEEAERIRLRQQGGHGLSPIF